MAESPTERDAPIAPAPVDPGVAGASSRRNYERLHAARERRARARLGILGLGLARIAGDPSSTRAWRKGANGEVKVAARLAKQLDDSGVRLLHDRRMSGDGRANIDHLAVGPGGVTVIDAKALSGKVRVETVSGLFSQSQRLLRVAGHDRTRLVRSVQRQAEVVRERLRESGLQMVDVRCALCFASTDGLPWRRLELDGVMLAGPKRVAGLARRPGPLGETEVERVLYALAKVLAPA
ncbi:MAG: nuclease-related domain-containing protein [Solirubrobacteraceae bacterium]